MESNDRRWGAGPVFPTMDYGITKFELTALMCMHAICGHSSCAPEEAAALAVRYAEALEVAMHR